MSAPTKSAAFVSSALSTSASALFRRAPPPLRHHAYPLPWPIAQPHPPRRRSSSHTHPPTRLQSAPPASPDDPNPSEPVTPPSSIGPDGDWRGSVKSVHWWDRPMRKLTTDVDTMSAIRVIVEIRDARIPRTGTHELFAKWRALKRAHYIVLYTHEDAISDAQRARLVQWTVDSMKVPPENVFVEDLRGHKDKRPAELKHITGHIRALCLADGLPSRGQVLKALVVGVPNVGKSSFVYTVTKEMTKRKKKKQLYHAPNVRDYAGETQNIKSHWMFEKPNIMLTDSPGIFPPSWILEADNEAVYKLAVCGGLNLVDTATTPQGLRHREVAEYLLYKLNQLSIHEYVTYFKLNGPTNDVQEILDRVTQVSGNSEKEKCISFIRTFNMGLLGEVIFDDISAADNSMIYKSPDEDDEYGANLLSKQEGRNGPAVEVSESFTRSQEPVTINPALAMPWPGAEQDLTTMEKLLGKKVNLFGKPQPEWNDLPTRRRRDRDEWRGERGFQSDRRRYERPGGDSTRRNFRETSYSESLRGNDEKERFRRRRDRPEAINNSYRDVDQGFDRRGRNRDDPRPRSRDDAWPDEGKGSTSGEYIAEYGGEARQRHERARRRPADGFRSDPYGNRDARPTRFDDRRRDGPGRRRQYFTDARDFKEGSGRREGWNGGQRQRSEWDEYVEGRGRAPRPRRSYPSDKRDEWEIELDNYQWNENGVASVRPDRIPGGAANEDLSLVDRSRRREKLEDKAQEEEIETVDPKMTEEQEIRNYAPRRRPRPPPEDELEFHFDDADF